jgi:hypothetical protein
MSTNRKLRQGAEEYRQKLKLGLVEKSKPLGPFNKAKQNPKSLRMAINAYCYDCCCEQKTEVKYCTAADCPFHHLRPWQPKGVK